MNTKIDSLIDRINRIVEQEVTVFIDERIDILLREVSVKYGISYQDLVADYKRSRDIKKRKCSMITILGHSCKYDAKPDDELCRKHFNEVCKV